VTKLHIVDKACKGIYRYWTRNRVFELSWYGIKLILFLSTNSLQSYHELKIFITRCKKKKKTNRHKNIIRDDCSIDKFKINIVRQFNPRYPTRGRSICKIELNVNIRQQKILRLHLCVLRNHANIISIKNLICKFNITRDIMRDRKRE